MRNHRILELLPFLVLASLVLQISGSLSLRPVLIGPDMAYLGSKVAFQCKVPGSSPPVTYELMRDTYYLVASGTDLQGNQAKTFSVKVDAASEGSYHCKATTDEHTGISNSIKLLVVIPVIGARVTSDPHPPFLYENSRLTLNCVVTKGSHLSYTWFFNRKEVTSSTLPLLRPTGSKLVVENVTAKHAGNYSCMAGAMVRDNHRFSSSGEVQVIVKVYFSAPRISFSISKEGTSYSGNVTCWSSRGSPPATFHLLLDDKEVGSVVATRSLVAWFPVAMVPARDMGTAQCRLESEVQRMMSAPLTLEVVPVGGRVTVEVEYLYRADSKMAAARLHCHLSKGTFPSFSWLLNNSLLSAEGHVPSHSHIHTLTPHYALTDRGHALILPRLSPKESGYYRCRARDSYDDSAPWLESEAVLVHVKEIAMPSLEVISIVFCCFLLLVLAGGVACVIMMFRRQQARVDMNRTTNSDALPLSTIASKPDDTSSIDNTVHSQIMEVTI